MPHQISGRAVGPPATVEISGNTKCTLVESSDESGVYRRIRDAWLQHPISSGGAGFYDFDLMFTMGLIGVVFELFCPDGMCKKSLK